MNILELDSYNLADAVKFNEKLNPRIWQGDKMKPQVRAKLLQIAEDFKQSLGLSDLEVKDITVSGSNAGYTYTPNSDIDLHLVVDLPQADSSEVYRELFDAKKFQYNETHNITIGGYDVELYVENANEPPVSQGMYSVVNDDWINIPKKRRATVDDNAVKSKYDVMKHRIESAIASKNFKRLTTTAAKIKKMRQAGLDKHGELGPENLAYKMLRTQGTIKALYDARTAAQDKKLSLKEQPKKPRVKYGFAEDVGITPDGVSPSTKMFLSEVGHESEKLVSDFIHDTANWLGIEKMPVIELHSDPEWGEANHSFGRFDPDSHTLHVNLANRHVMDILRTTAHELAHCKQHENNPMPTNAGDTGSPWENEAHAVAGIIMRNYAEKHPELFSDAPEITESASGYIPKNKKEARDPRYSMAVTVDIKPGQVGKEANKLALQTDSQGKPALLMKTANTLAESLSQELALFEQDLFEVKMTSKNLAKLAKDIPGVKVGLEFEMIVPNAKVDDDGDMEPDYEQDERVRDIDDAVNFFDDGDYNGRRELRQLREAMESDFFDWQIEQIDEAWDRNGFEFFTEYVDREEPFDPTDYEDQVEDDIKAEYPDLDPESDEFEELKSEKLREIEANYYTETWEAQGGIYDRAREEFEQEIRDNGDYNESVWLDDQNIRYASDVESNYGYVSWPYYTSSSDDDEADIERVALDFMNGIGADTVAYSSSYHGSYKKWTGNGWVLVGSEKPDDCFSIEPDGSLDGNSSDDVGLEFVSPPTPLEQVPDLMKRVQNWAGEYGVYTGKNNKTSIHTNISVPGYDLNKLDYLKAALLLGDEYVLREFDRIGNSYAKPAIEKVKNLVQQKPEKAQELLDKMKSQLNAEASKLIHSGVTDKFTSINTKNNRVEFRSPGGDYLSIIADKPQKMMDTINRMVVTLDAAMNPDKYKQEYQKKLYKVLTGQGGGREAKTGKKQEMKASDKDLLNIFSRYAAGELPKQALKSFVRQAQLERSVAKGKQAGKMWWNVQWDANRRMEVVAGSADVAKQVAAEEWGVPEERLAGATVTPLRPYKEGETTQQPEIPGSNIYRITTPGGTLIAGDEYDNDQAALRRAQYWAQHRNTDVVVRNARGEEVGRVSSIGDITPAAQQPSTQFGAARGAPNYAIVRDSDGTVVHRFYADNRSDAIGQKYDFERMQGWNSNEYSLRDESESTPTAQQSAQPGSGEYGIWITSSERFARMPAAQAGGDPNTLRTFPSREAAEEYLTVTRGENPRMRNDIEVREIPQGYELPAPLGRPVSPAFGGNHSEPVTYEIYNRNSGAAIDTFTANSDQEALQKLEDYRNSSRHSFTPEQARLSFGVRRGPGVTNTAPQPAGSTDAEQGGIVDVAGDNWSADFERRMQGGGNNPEWENPQPAPTFGGSFTGEWKIVDPNGNEIYRFSGVGNAQSDANRVAMQWLQRNPRQMVAGVEVLPVMG